MYHYQSFRVQHCHLACSKEQLNISHSGKVYLLPGCVRPAMHAACYSSVVLLFPLQLDIAVAEQCSSATAMFIPTVICECQMVYIGMKLDEVEASRLLLPLWQVTMILSIPVLVFLLVKDEQ